MKISLVKSFLQVEGDLKLDMTLRQKDGSIKFTGHRLYGEKQPIEITMDKYQVEAIEACKGIKEVHDCYKEFGYF